MFTYQNILEKIDSGESFSFSRFGDGEWSAILGFPGSNCDGHVYFPSLGKALKEMLEVQPDYYLGMQNHAKKNPNIVNDPEFKRLEQMNDWTNADIIHNHNAESGLYDLFEVLKKKDVVIVGHEGLRGMEKYFPIADFIEVPKVNAWNEMWSVSRAIDNSKFQDATFLFCSGMMSNVLIHYHDFGDWIPNRHLIDIGSAFQPYVNEPSRSYHYKLKLK